MTNNAYYYKAQMQQVTAFPRYNELAAELRTRKQQMAAFSRCNELLRAQLRTSKQQATALSQHNEKLAAELQTSKQQVAALSEHSEQVRVELEEAKAKAMQHEEENRTLRMEIKALQNKVETASQENQDLETQLTVSPRCLCPNASDEDTDDYVVVAEAPALTQQHRIRKWPSEEISDSDFPTTTSTKAGLVLDGCCGKVMIGDKLEWLA
uniref:Uncharacterized protein n=1 Tax=Phytophthora ramorum TaxID=164328 RepID=H3H8S1_PHYRM